ncbi:MAG: hypothetical protein GXZ00_04060 [Synergistaceae bacterium]|nr:hypothetical protein [Synergistaceae bacterium]
MAQYATTTCTKTNVKTDLHRIISKRVYYWRPGDDVIVPTAGSYGTAKERMETKDDNTYCLDWFMYFRKEKIAAYRAT